MTNRILLFAIASVAFLIGFSFVKTSEATQTNSLSSTSTSGSIQGLIVDGSGRPLVLKGAGIVLRPLVSIDSPIYIKAEPTFYMELQPGYYLANFDIPNQFVSFSTCPNCVFHPANSFVNGSQALIEVRTHTFTDIHFKVLHQAAVEAPGSQTGKSPISTSRVIDCSIAGNCANSVQNIGLFNNTVSSKWSYAFAPAIVHSGNIDHIFYCSTGNRNSGGMDIIRSFSNQDFQIRTQVNSRFLNQEDGAACDPTIVFFKGYYYMYYASVMVTNTNPYFQQNVIQVARSASIQGPYLTYTKRNTWEMDAEDPKAVILPKIRRTTARAPYEIGAAFPSVVVKDGRIMMWYVDDSHRELPQDKNAISFISSTDPVNWDLSKSVNLTLKDIHSGEVKYNPATGEFIMFSIRDPHSTVAQVVAAYSRDGLNWSSNQLISAAPKSSHNLGVRSSELGHLKSGHLLQIFYGAPYGLRDVDTWGEWDLATTIYQ